jgi:hypothetical protein
MMYYYYDSFNPALLSIFFCVLVLISSFFVLNLMLAAIWSKFKEVSDDEKQKLAEEMKTIKLKSSKITPVGDMNIETN